MRAGMGKVKSENVTLYDPYPSSISGYMAIREVLWNLVEKISQEDLSETPPEDEIQLGGEGLPLNFKSKRISFPSKRKNRRRTNILTFSESRSEHNIYMGYNQFDSLFYPCRVVGLGPHFQSDAETAIVYFLGYGNFAEVYRETQILPVPLDRLEEVQLLVYNDTLSRTQGGVQPTGITKYFDQRYRLFSRYDSGILLDEESWFSITPEIISRDIANKCMKSSQSPLNIVLDPFSGVGGNAIPLAQICKLLIVGDIDQSKLVMLRHNAKIYTENLSPLSTPSNIEFIHSDAYQLIKSFVSLQKMIDLVVLAPPWGGINYTKSSKYFDLHTMIPSPSGDGYELLELTSQVTTHIVFIIPKNTSLRQLEEISELIHLPVRIEKISLYDKLKMTVAYYGHNFQSIDTLI